MKAGHLNLVSINHHTAPVEVREQFHLSEIQQQEFQALLRDCFSIRESLILTTCNRLEIYSVSEEDQGEAIISLLTSFRCLPPDSGLQSHFLIENDSHRAIRHLFRVAIGLESPVLGDIQIFGQVKKAYQQATDLAMAGPFLHRLLHTIFACHKEVASTTAFKHGAASVSHNAARIIQEQLLAEPTDPVLVIGTGKMGQDVCGNLTNLGFTNISVTNRTQEHALDMIRENSYRWIEYADFRDKLSQFKVVVNTAHCPEPLIKRHQFSETTYPTFVDLAAPRGIDESFASVTRLINIDEICKLQQKTLEKRKEEVPTVESIIASYCDEFEAWSREIEFTGSLKKFRETLEQLRKEVLTQFLKNNQQENLALIDQVTDSMIQKIVKLPALSLKQACQREEAGLLSDSLNSLFNPEHHQIKQ